MTKISIRRPKRCPIQAESFLSDSMKEFQSEDFLCSQTPWDALLHCADQKVGILGRRYICL